MRRLVLAVALLVLTEAAQAEWTAPWEYDDGGGVAYIDKSTIRVRGTKRQVWFVTNFAHPKEVSGKPLTSLRGLLILDCEEESVSYTEQNIFSEAYGKGRPVVTKIPDDPAGPVLPNTFAAAVFKMLCDTQ